MFPERASYEQISLCRYRGNSLAIRRPDNQFHGVFTAASRRYSAKKSKLPEEDMSREMTSHVSSF